MDACFRLRNQPSCRLSEGRPAAIVYDIRKSMSRVDNFRTTAIYTGRLLTIPYILGIPFNACVIAVVFRKRITFCAIVQRYLLCITLKKLLTKELNGWK